MFRLGSSLVAIITPFQRDGKLDLPSLEKLVDWHASKGTDGIVCAGTTGEGIVLSVDERKEVLRCCLRAASGRMAIIAGTGTADTRETVRLTEQALTAGAQGCLVVAPYYNKPTQRGCIAHFSAVSEVGLPMIIYNNPGRTVIQLAPETIAEIGLLPSVVGLKESSSDPLFLKKIRALSSIPIWAGEDSLTCAMIEHGAQGAISVIANMIPATWKKMIALCLEKKWGEAKDLYGRVEVLVRALAQEVNPQGIKHGASRMHAFSALPRLPLVVPTQEVAEKIDQAWAVVQELEEGVGVLGASSV